MVSAVGSQSTVEEEEEAKCRHWSCMCDMPLITAWGCSSRTHGASVQLGRAHKNGKDEMMDWDGAWPAMRIAIEE